MDITSAVRSELLDPDARAWQNAGYQVEDVDLSTQRVRFTRRSMC